MNLKIEDIAAHRSFVFLWCGSCEGLDLGREVGNEMLLHSKKYFSVSKSGDLDAVRIYVG